jgi:dTDP-4-dehydrorhamnose reductase
VAQACPRSLVVRSASRFDAAPVRGKARHFVDAILAQAVAAKPLTVVDDVRISEARAPTG